MVLHLGIIRVFFLTLARIPVDHVVQKELALRPL
jgi:hypothetical protein